MGKLKRVQKEVATGPVEARTEVTFDLEVLPTAIGLEALVRLQKIAGPALGELLGSKGVKEGGARALVELSSRVSLVDVNWFRMQLASRTVATVKDETDPTGVRVLNLSKDEAQDALFAGNYSLLLAWLEFGLEANFPDFLESLRSWLVPAPAAEPAPTPAPTT